MKKKVKSNINLEALAGGAFTEKLNEALMQVAENIQNPNTDATAKRSISVTLKFAPNKTRQLVNTTIAVTTKLAATEAIDTQMIMGVNMRTGQLEIAEYDGQIRGQMSLSELEPEERTEPAAVPQQATQPQVETQRATLPPVVNRNDTAPDPVPTGKPLDLKNRNKQTTEQSERAATAAVGGRIPGVDFDVDTGVIYEKDDQRSTEGQPATENKVVNIGQKAANS